MPQSRRKVPFSGKKKKEQIFLKRQQKAQRNNLIRTTNSDSSDEENKTNETKVHHIKLTKRGNSGRYALQFFEESENDILQAKKQAREPLKPIEPEKREISQTYFENYDFPIRPPWNYKMSKAELDRNENRYFTDYINALEKKQTDQDKPRSIFELNLETWRQLWRVLEISDILLLIVDVRYASLMFPPFLFEYVTKTLKKPMVLVLNKLDLVRPEVAIAWKHYFMETYPGISVVFFASYATQTSQNMKIAKRKPQVQRNEESVLDIYKTLKGIVGPELDLSSWEDKILADMAAGNLESAIDSIKCETTGQNHLEKYEFDFEEHEKYKNGILTIGCIGFPNVGKSSIINALKGRKVVSVSRTPGHTKYFQTIFLTNNVKLCDCPGLVFPSTTPKYLQVILGSYPIAQLKEPYQSIRYIAESVNLPDLLGIELPEGYSEWSAIAICEGWAIKRNFRTAKASRPDIYRAANNLLRLTLQGKIVVEMFPPNYFQNKEKWEDHDDKDSIKHFYSAATMDEEAVAGGSCDCVESESENEEPSTKSSMESSGDEADLESANTFSILDEN